VDQADGEELKRQAAVRAAEWIEEGMVVGLGTGSTVRHLLEEVARRRGQGEWSRIVGIPTSQRTAERADALGIPLSDLASHPVVDITIDGADEVDPELNLIKGLGGALLREKIVAVASRLLIIMVDSSKSVPRLGTRAPLPVEVDRFGAAIQPPFLRSLGAEPTLRLDPAGQPFITDGGNHIYDCRFPGGIEAAAAVEAELNNRPGIVENGLFIGLADHVVIAGDGGTRVRSRAGSGS
jgi:ribose 5-phosphate isomerase A